MVKRISCAESDHIRHSLIFSTHFTDLDGQFEDEPQLVTVWHSPDGAEVLKDIRYFHGGFDIASDDQLLCEHWLLNEED